MNELLCFFRYLLIFAVQVPFLESRWLPFRLSALPVFVFAFGRSFGVFSALPVSIIVFFYRFELIRPEITPFCSRRDLHFILRVFVNQKRRIPFCSQKTSPITDLCLSLF
jgi:hypothetical protein